MRTRRVFLAAGLALLLGAAGCGGAGAGPGPGDPRAGGREALRVVATTTQVADFARAVGGDRIALTQILKPNVDPHDYEPSPADLVALARADVVVRNGVGLDRWFDQALRSAESAATVVDASRGIRIRRGDPRDGARRAGDPHVWHDPRNAGLMVATIARAFTAADPAGAPTYRADLARYRAELDALDADVRRRIERLPVDRRLLVTNHDAFGYYAERYGLRIVGSILPSFDTSAELSGRSVQDLVAKIRETGVRAVFSESSLPPRTADTIGKEAGVKVEAGPDSLYGDTLGPPGSAGGTYLAMERHNTDTIVSALGGPGA